MFGTENFALYQNMTKYSLTIDSATLKHFQRISTENTIAKLNLAYKMFYQKSFFMRKPTLINVISQTNIREIKKQGSKI